jgi:hypothetical protein
VRPFSHSANCAPVPTIRSHARAESNRSVAGTFGKP